MNLNRLASKVPAIRLVVVATAIALGSLLPLASASGGASPRTCFGKRATIVGTQHADVIHGTTHRDVIISLDGNDHVYAGQGPDFVCAGPGDDVVHGAEGFNRMHGGPGKDWLDGRRGPGN